MTANELAFLALGLGLGTVVAATLLQVYRSRNPRPRRVFVTIEPNAIPRRAGTLATMTTPARNAVAPMGPADRRNHDRPDDEGVAPTANGNGRQAAPRRGSGTSVPFGNGFDAVPLVLPARYGVIPKLETGTGPVAASGHPLIGIPIEDGADPVLAALTGEGVGYAADLSDPADGTDPARAAMPIATAVAVAEPETDKRPRASFEGGAAAGSPPDRRDDGPCADARLLSDERCAVASRAAEEADRAAEELASARRRYDSHLSRAEAAAADADPRAARAAKDAAQQAYRVARSAARTTEEQEAAAATWLAEINRVNGLSKEAAGSVTREREAAAALVLVIERMTVQADAARISAEAAQEQCTHAREALAECEERASVSTPARGGRRPEPESTRDDIGLPDEASALSAATSTGPVPRIVRLLRGERAALIAVVDALAGPDPSQRRHWQLLVTDLTDAIVARAIEESMLDFPDEHPFWGTFSRPQCRDIAAALASLGYRFDGLGGFADGRVPTQRDLSLALGYAGLDPMRIRVWPSEAEASQLFADVRVAADEYLGGAGGDLTLAEMIDLLGRRADALADLWNNWGRARPALLVVE